jgi:GAF domain
MGYGDAMGTSAQHVDTGVTDHAELGRLVEEQSALRRVATLVAQGASASAEVFAAVAQEVVQVLHLSNAAICRFDAEGSMMTVVAVWGDRPESVQVGSRWPLDGPSMSAEILRTGRPARVEDYRDLPGSLASEARQGGFISVAGAPIIVEGRGLGNHLDLVTAPAAPGPSRGPYR